MIANHLQLMSPDMIFCRHHHEQHKISTTAHYKIYIIDVVDDFQSSTIYNTIYMIYVVDDC